MRGLIAQSGVRVRRSGRWRTALVVAAVGLGCTARAPLAHADTSGGGGVEQDAVHAWIQRFSNGAFGSPQCSWTPPVDPVHRPEGVVEVDGNGVVWVLYLRVCDGIGSAIWVPTVAPGLLAEVAADRARRALPRPEVMLSPALRSVTQLPTWFWTAGWAPIEAVAAVPGAVARARAEPVALEFEPGDGARGDGPVSCPGPGRPWHASDADSDSPCRVTYRHTPAVEGKARWSARATIRWRISTVVAGAPGPVVDATTTTVVPVVVVELHGLVAR